ncbi:uncharacterized protein LOC126678271 [Mercurialis annua]|uniref:uncharacterized protein LOC126678271 n=1 Tax=Mercurialis annua TaxID=3986 RepID=UPI00215EEA4A|nr:uncharacterized protein LOC126678271 [Mercurialis annua]
MEETHGTTFSIHPGSTKMYHDVKGRYWWNGMKRDIAQYIAKFSTCQQLNVDINKHMDSYNLYPFQSGSGQGIPWTLCEIGTGVYDKIVSLHRVPVSIVSYRGSTFTSRFWKSLQEALGTQLDFSTTFHPQIDDFGGSWDTYLPLVEFLYNNSYHSSIEMAPYEALYGRRCRSPICWEEVGERKLTGAEIVQVSPMKSVIRFCKKGKFSPRYVGPYLIVERIRKVSYKLELPPDMSQNVHGRQKIVCDKNIHTYLTLVVGGSSIEEKNAAHQEQLICPYGQNSALAEFCRRAAALV